MTPPVPIGEQIAEIGRELGLRRGVYAKFVAQGKYTQAEADRRIAAMESAYATLKWVERHRARILALAPELKEDET